MTDAANIALEAVLSTRDVTSNDNAYAVNITKHLTSERNTVKNRVKRRFQFQLVFIGIAISVALLVKFYPHVFT